MYKGMLILLLVVVLPCRADNLCSHRDGSWEHRVVENGSLDIATKMLDSRVRIYIGGVPGKLQLIRLDGVGRVKTDALKSGEPNPLRAAFVTIGSDVYKKDKIASLYSQANGGSITIPMRELLQYILRSRILHISIEGENNKMIEYDIDVRDIPLGSGHDC
ncbi:hypothetical protein I5R28_10710 [Serratia marcescens]|nr:hypothetical protein [Serratia marcescens]